MSPVRILRRNSSLATVLGFVVACLAGFLFLWAKANGTVPGITKTNAYRVSFQTSDVKNLRDMGEVRIAGVQVGRVESRTLEGDEARVDISLDKDAAPLHEGATVRVGVKSLVGSSFVDIVDGAGPALPNNSMLPSSMVKPAVDVDELFATLDAPTREALRASVRSLGRATGGTSADVDRVMTGLGRLGEEGHTALDALADQSKDLQALTREATTLLSTLDTGRGQIARLVQDAQRLTGATAGKREAVEETVRALPGLLTEVKTGAIKLRELSGPLGPVAADLRRAAPDLNRALVNLPAVTDDLYGLLPELDATLERAPATLDRVPAFGADVRALIPDAQTLLRDVNPMLVYLKPYGRDLGAMFANFGASFDTLAEDGIRPVRLTASSQGVHSIRGIPVPLDLNALYWNNPYPQAGQADQPAPFQGSYPRVERDPE